MEIDLNEQDSNDTNGDGEGVWSPDIEQCFREALLLFPPCGRRKHILQEEGGGKMYGRNELIARHIMMRTGKSRTRKQVSSHIQVLARRKAKAEASGSTSSMMSPSPNNNNNANNSSRPHSANARMADSTVPPQNRLLHPHQLQQQQHHSFALGDNEIWADRPIVTNQIRLVEFSAFIEYRKLQQQQQQQQIVPNNLVMDQSAQVGQTNSLLSSIGGSINVIPQQLTSTLVEQTGTSAHLQMKVEPGLQTFQQQQQQASSLAPTNGNVLASNHHLPAQYNQATAYQTSLAQAQVANNNQTYNNNNNQLQQQKVTPINVPFDATNQCPQLGVMGLPMNNNNINNNLNHQHQLHHPQTITSSGFVRHSYVQIDYKHSLSRQANNKLEMIDISQIQDKFPEIGGANGLFQRGPADAFFLVKFWADLTNDYEYNIEDQNSYFGFSSHFETTLDLHDITCSTKACSYGRQVVEKVEKVYRDTSKSSNGGPPYSFIINRSPMCEFMIKFIKTLRQLPRASQMNSVLENFSVLQVITDSTAQILLCLAYVFEVGSLEQNNSGPQYNVYKLIKDSN